MTRLATLPKTCAAALLALLPVLGAPSSARATDPGTIPRADARPLDLPDTVLVDEQGRKVRFRSDVVHDRVVAIQLIFTTCGTICPPLGANFGKLRKLLGDRAGRDVELISLSVDPTADTPERLKAWATQFGYGPGWTLLTGPEEDVRAVRKALQVDSGDKSSHSPLVLVGNPATGTWTRAYGLASPATLVAAIDEVAKGPAPAASAASAAPAAPAAKPAPEAAPAGESSAAGYFTDVILVDQDGRERRLYSDLLKGRTVVINTFFTHCEGSCPVTAGTFRYLQEQLAGHLGKEMTLLSISVDPATDTPTRLKEYAARFAAGPDWLLLTGSPENVRFALSRLGQWVDHPDAHSNILLVGNDRTGLWKKVFALGKREEVLAAVKSVVEDRN
jgi:cytochrome oxidase Cu insertion factor (SCO1/SenC/PrrC family)